MLAIISYVWNHVGLICLRNCLVLIRHGITVSSFSMCWTKTQISPVFFVRSPCTGGHAVGTCAGLRGGWTGWVDRLKSAPHQSSSVAIVVRVQLGVQVSFWRDFLKHCEYGGSRWMRWEQHLNSPLAMEVDLFMFDIAHAMYISMHIDKDYSIIAQKQVLLY